ncbi:CU044_5270 family protein [Streptomyces sp. 71268]|uniref:CU044_5270 family protein n=1 Tax=Streptomyces sp. 71268 TaxID=3002640 RepID=UPI0023F96D40|nr:CU044_5270 family protein [Streptomyces sp. 71268]WEV26115.1 CU044_5270 family protein [Streptomyces sp. 71268]
MTDLPSAPERDLPPGRHHLLREHLLSELHQAAADQPRADVPRPARPWLRPAFASLAVAGTLAVVVLASLTLTAGGVDETTSGRERAASYAFVPDVGADERGGAPRVLEHAADFAEQERVPGDGRVRDDQYVYVDSKVTPEDLSRDQPKVPEPRRRTSWSSVDGEREGRVHDEALGTHTVGPGPEAREPTYGTITNYRHLQSLPTDPNALYARLCADARANGFTDRDQGQATFHFATQLINGTLMPPDVAAALFRAAARIPGLVVVENAVDAAGRHGVAVGRAGEGEDVRLEWIFDRVTGQLLGTRVVLLADTALAKAGTVTYTAAVLRRAIVDKAGEHPAEHR